MNGSTTGGETVTLSLSAEVSVDADEARALNHKLGANANGEVVPMPVFSDGELVDVHTILKSSTGTAVAKTLKWKYVASKKKLVLSQSDGHDITVSGFNNDSGVKWYISGLIGGDLAGTKVEFMGTRVVKGVDGNAGDALGSMSVPYAFGWTELTINTSSPKDGNNSHKYAEVPTSKNVKFKPMGSMLAVKLGTNQPAGSYTFTPKGFTISSNAWGDQGSFELNTTIPSTNPHTSLPTWKESSCAGSMYYTFASGEEPGTIAHNQTTGKTYYVWVISHTTQPTAAADVRVMLKGESSRPETVTYKDYTNTWFTDYTTKAGTQGKVTQGKVHPLTAKASHRVALPIEYVTEYNLAGGEGLTATVAAGATTGYLNSPQIGGIQPAGVTGPLRFATSHDNDQSGYYNWYKIAGRHHADYNPDTRNLQAEVDATFGADKYYMPTIEQWWGVYPAVWPWGIMRRPWQATNEELNTTEWAGIGLGGDILRQTYESDYSRGFTSPYGSNDDENNAVFYAIRFQSRTRSCTPITHKWGYDATTGEQKPYIYPSAPDNSMKCAYRFTRVGGRASWEAYGSTAINLTNQFIVDVVYLGEEATPTELATISDELWWSTKKSQDKVFSKIFPAAGEITPTGGLGLRDRWGLYHSYSQSANSQVYGVSFGAQNIFSANWNSMGYSYPARLFSHPGL